jgi:hypothetical protein
LNESVAEVHLALLRLFMESGLILRAVSKKLNVFVPSNYRKVMLRLREEK